MQPFDIKKFVASFVQILPWIKTARFAIGLGVFAFVGLTIYRAYIMPTSKHTTQIIAQSGANISVSEQKAEKKGRVSLHPYVEGYGFSEEDHKPGLGARAGLRIEI